MLRILREKLSRKKQETNRAVEVTEMQTVTPKLVNRGCAHCRYAIIKDGWHIELNRCSLRSLVLGKDITKEDGCKRFEDVRM
jgi:hypothetical protein